MTIGYLGLGSNVGDRRAQLQAAVETRWAHGVAVLGVVVAPTTPTRWARSSTSPSFLNACLRIETALEPEALLDACKAAERELGRAQPGGATSATGRGRSTSTCCCSATRPTRPSA